MEDHGDWIIMSSIIGVGRQNLYLIEQLWEKFTGHGN